jgi:hypothetical protein
VTRNAPALPSSYDFAAVEGEGEGPAGPPPWRPSVAVRLALIDASDAGQRLELAVAAKRP